MHFLLQQTLPAPSGWTIIANSEREVLVQREKIATFHLNLWNGWYQADAPLVVFPIIIDMWWCGDDFLVDVYVREGDESTQELCAFFPFCQ